MTETTTADTLFSRMNVLEHMLAEGDARDAAKVMIYLVTLMADQVTLNSLLQAHLVAVGQVNLDKIGEAMRSEEFMNARNTVGGKMLDDLTALLTNGGAGDDDRH